MADRTQHEGKTERATESHDQCSQPPGMRLLKTADRGTQVLWIVNSFKLHLTAFYFHCIFIIYLISFYVNDSAV